MMPELLQAFHLEGYAYRSSVHCPPSLSERSPALTRHTAPETKQIDAVAPCARTYYSLRFVLTFGINESNSFDS